MPRCHDHKFDPIPTQDYYSIAGIFWSSRLADLPLASKDVVAKQAEAQKKAQDAEKRVKDFLQAEKERIARAEAEKLSQYLLAAWKLEAKRLDTPKMPVGDQAKVDKLNAAALDRFCKFMTRKGNNLPVLDKFNKAMPKKGDKLEPGAEVVKIAQEVRDQVKAILNKPANDKARADLFTAFYGDKGIFPINDSDARKALDLPRKDQLATLEKEVGAFEKGDPAGSADRPRHRGCKPDRSESLPARQPGETGRSRTPALLANRCGR